MYAVCVACNASSAEIAVTFASSYSHPHLFPPVLLVAEVPVPDPVPVEPVVDVTPEAELRETDDEPEVELLLNDVDEDVTLLSRHNAV